MSILDNLKKNLMKKMDEVKQDPKGSLNKFAEFIDSGLESTNDDSSICRRHSQSYNGKDELRNWASKWRI